MDTLTLGERAPRHAGPRASWAARSSVVICAYTMARWEDTVAAVDSVRSSTTPPAEIILVIDHHAALFARARARFEAGDPAERAVPVRVLLSEGQPGLSAARNCGIRAAEGEIVVFLDDDAVADGRWLERLTAPFDAPAVLAVGGRAVPADPGAVPWWLPGEYLWVVGCSWTGLPGERTDVRNVIGCAMAFRAAPLRAAGGFSPLLGRKGDDGAGGEETEVCIRLGRAAGARVVYEPAALVHHRVDPRRYSLRYFAARCLAEGRSKARLARLAGGHSLGDERRHARRILGRSIGQVLAGAACLRWRTAARGLIAASGLVLTGAGYLHTRWEDR